ncbi:MAG: LuxR C-terminal-related transcriptional regulator [Chthoniobacteraceae bacterium]
MNSKAITTEALAKTFGGMRELGIADRKLFEKILHEILANNPDFFGVWTVWEPNALDGRDRDFTNAPGHDDAGQFIPFWNRAGGKIRLEPNLGFDVPGYGDWYLVPRQRGVETVMDPYEFPCAGKPQFITTQVSPIYARGEWVGAVGVDIAVDEIERAKLESVEEMIQRGYIFLGESGEVDYCSPRTRNLLSGYIGGCPEGILPRPLQRPVAALQSSAWNSAAARDAELPMFRRGEKILRVKAARHPRSNRLLLVLEEIAAPAPETALTAREHDVYQWLKAGKSNAEISIILGISIHTVKRHVEHILPKIGAENRYAAALSSMKEAE